MTRSSLKSPKIIIVASLIAALLITMTISDIYYSKLEKDYPLLTNSEEFQGTVTHTKDHWDYTYLEVDNEVKRLVSPAENLDLSPSSFSDFIAAGDQIRYGKSSSTIEVIRNGKVYPFDLTQSHP